MRRKTSSRFPICTKLSAKEASPGLASFKPTLTGIGKREGFFRRMFRRGPNLDRKIQNHKNAKSKMKKNIGWTCKNIFFRFWQTKSQIDHMKRYKTIVLLGF